MTEDDFIYDEDLQGGEWVLNYPGYDSSFSPLLYFEWSTYEEWGCLFILQKYGNLYEWTYGHYVMSSEEDEPEFEPRRITIEEAMEYIDEWSRY